MPGIASVGQLVAVIQSQLATRGRAVAGKAPARPARAGGGRKADGLQGLIELRVRQIAPDDPGRGRKAFRIFLESVLLAELGEGLNADPRFHQLVDDVQRTLEADARCAPLVQDAITHLLGGKPADLTKGS
ncbi:hypothetical protein E7V67_022405 [[Empedobacter] haloabium]|uniref:Uncharacterized protein n=1 Tax=[Empedobacter] haloabium TaxID=592317 RepID=A0ABZ1UIT6_9BURK